MTRRLPTLLGSACLAVTASLANPAQAGTAFVHLFEWKWNDIAAECENFLGPKGFDAVQISPPQEHITVSNWWARYQPVSFTNLNSRSGSETELQNMINRCHAAGVKIYADVVMNNWASNTAGGNYGSGGDYWTPRNYPDLGSQDFHNDCTVNNYQDANNVWDCGLLGMPDLNTGTSYSQAYAAAYMQRLTSMGVDGFRIDAAKHIRPGELDSIMSQAGRPWAFLEVIGAAGEAVQPSQYTYIGQVTEFGYGTAVKGNFDGQIKNLRTLGTSWGLLPSASATVFIVNHDRERGHGGGGMYTYKDGAKYNLANVFMLAFPYGYPKVMSGYAFTDPDAGPPSSGPANCTNSAWNCDHRWANIANMAEFRNYTTSAWTVDNWWDNGSNAIAFGRGNKGFVVINNESYSLTQRLYTGLPAATYCNVLSAAEPCNGTKITVDGAGYATFTVAAYSAAAIHGGKVDGGGGGDDYTSTYPTMNFRGTPNSWGTTAMTLVADHTWEATITFSGNGDANGAQRFKFDMAGNWVTNFGDTNGDGVANQGGSDIHTSVTGQYKVRFNDQTLAYSLTPVGSFGSNFSTMYFRGTPNSWGTTAMTLVANNTWQVTVNFSGSGDSNGSQRFKFDAYANWATNWGDSNADGLANASGADIFTSVSGTYLVTFNDATLAYTVTAQ